MTPEALAQTHAAAFQTSRPWSAAEFADLLSGAGVILCGDARSFVLGRVILDEAEVLTVATAPAFQNNGLASLAMATFCAHAAASGATTIFLEVAEDNTAAKALYYNSNFEVSGRRSNYYRSPTGLGVDALIMRKALK